MTLSDDHAAGLVAIQERFGFIVPDRYRELLMAGSLTPFAESHLQFSDLNWLTPAAIAAWEFHRDQISGLVPIAATEHHDLWCWYPALNDGGPAPVVYCPDEDEVAIIYAPSFEAWLYRLLLDEYACTGLTEHVDVRQSRTMLKTFAEQLAPMFPDHWVARLDDLAQRQPTCDANDYYGVVDADELENILIEDISYARLDEEFLHVIDE